MTKRYRPGHSKAPQAVGGRARARKLSATQRHEIAMMGARAAAQKEGRPLIEDEMRIIPPSVRKEMYKNAAEHKLIAELMFDPPAWMQHFLINYESGDPFVLYPAQETFLREAFSPDPETLKLKYDTVIFAAPKKSGKTALAAMCLLYVVGVLGGERAEGYIVSNSREQASDRVFADCCSILKASPQLSGFANVTNDAIEFPATNSFIKTVTTEASSAAGSRPTIVVGDEIWGFSSTRSVRLWDELAPTPTALVSVRLIVTYAGYTGESELLEKYYRRIFAEDGTLNPGVVQIATDLYAQGRTLVYWTHEMRAPWQTPEWVETMRREYSPNQFARIMENRWVNSESSFIEATSYDRCVDRQLRPAQANKGMRVWVGLDASLRRDSTAIVAVALDTAPEAETASLLRTFREREVLANPILEIAAALPWAEDYVAKENPVTLSTLRLKLIWHRIFVPQGRTINFAKIEEAILLLHRSFDLAAVAYDPTQMVAVAQGLTRFGVKMVELPATQANSMAFSSLLRDLIEQNRLRVYPADDLRQHVLAAASKESQRGWHIVKQSGAVKIDAAVALAEACHVAARYCAPSEVFMSSPSLIGDSLYGI